jgi:hypothetical protein
MVAVVFCVDGSAGRLIRLVGVSEDFPEPTERAGKNASP